ncbi:MAG: hypothetical protein AB1305_03185 [Candidatus Hadarchaeota archaeon]
MGNFMNLLKICYLIAGFGYLAFAAYLIAKTYGLPLSSDISIGLNGVIVGMVGVAVSFFALFYSFAISEKTEENAVNRHKELSAKIEKITPAILSVAKHRKTKRARPTPKMGKTKKSGKIASK